MNVTIILNDKRFSVPPEIAIRLAYLEAQVICLTKAMNATPPQTDNRPFKGKFR